MYGGWPVGAIVTSCFRDALRFTATGTQPDSGKKIKKLFSGLTFG